MNYKAIFTDADNTLLDRNSKISDDNKRAILRACEKGVRVTICSGRSYVNLIQFAEELGLNTKDNYISSFNGCIVCRCGSLEIIHREMLKKETVLEIISHLRQFEVDLIAYNSPEYTIIEKETDATNLYYSLTKMPHKIIGDFAEAMEAEIPKMMAFGTFEELDKIKRYMNNNILNDKASMFSSANTLLEFTAAKATKGNSIRYLSDLMGIDMSQTIAIGDNQNDVSMIKAAGLGVVVANAKPYIKSQADYVTKATNNESAVAEVINKFVL